MARRVIREEREQRGCFGWGLLILFWLFNDFMVYAVFGGLFNISRLAPAADQAEQTGRAIGTGIGLWLLASVWVMGDLILGIPVLLTRGHRVMVEETPQDDRDVDTSRWSERDRVAYDNRRAAE